MFRAVADGRIKALWIMATNPIDSMPEADGVREAIKECPFVVVSDVVRDTDTTAYAHVLLPSTAWGEKDGTVTNSERRISRQRAFLNPPGSAKPDWWQLAEVGRRMGYGAAFDFHSPRDIFVEHAALSGAANGGTRDFDISGLAALDQHGYDELAPTQWPQPAGGAPARDRFFADGGFYTPDRKGRFIATPYILPTSSVSPAYPFVLNTGRVRDQWHTMTRTGKAARLLTHVSEPALEIHPDDAGRANVAEGGLCVVASAHGSAVLRVVISSEQRRGSVFAPIHWSGQFASSGRIDAVVRADVDPISGQPGLKFTPVAVTPYKAAWFGLINARERPELGGADHWVAVPVASGWRAEVAGLVPLGDPAAIARKWLQMPGDAAIIAYSDAAAGQYSFAAFEGDRLAGTVFISREPVTAWRSWTSEQIGSAVESPAARLLAVAGRAGSAGADRGAIVCGCFGAGHNDIVSAIEKRGCVSVEAIGQDLKAGTNCGSCRPEISRILAQHLAATVS